MSDAFELAFMAAIDDLNAGRLADDPGHYLATVPTARHEEFTRRLSALMAARGPSAHDAVSREAYDAALAAVATVKASAGQAGILPGALSQLRKARGIERETLVEQLAVEYELGSAGREALRRYYHRLESGQLVGSKLSHRLLRSIAAKLDASSEDFISAARATVRASTGPSMRAVPAMGRSSGLEEPATSAGAGRGRTVPGREPDVELVEQLFCGGPDS
jgi:transcriptional regulator with XRE-family HTH domain